MGFMTGNGKIARPPRAIRDEPNRRMDDGQARQAPLPWLNGFPPSSIIYPPSSIRFATTPAPGTLRVKPGQTQSNQIKPNQTKSLRSHRRTTAQYPQNH
jgi:hypothetical protein